jgi:predicted N-acetyltransferase YhbS
VSYQFKFAASDAEFEGVRRLNHEVFAAEVGQHETQPNGLLVDRFESKSLYIVAIHEERVVGMVALHDQPPYSIEKRLSSAALLDELAGPLLEVRLLAIEPQHRRGMVIAGLMGRVILHALEAGYPTLLISGISERVELYRRLGFRALGPAVPDGKASFVPMALQVIDLPEPIRVDINRWRRREKLAEE